MLTVGEGSRLTAAVKWSRSLEGKWRVKWKSELLLINNFSSCANKRRRVELEWESVRQRRRGRVYCGYTSVLTLFVGWRAMKKWLLASLILTADKCWTMGRVQELKWNWYSAHINFLCGWLVMARRFCWVVSDIFECGTAGTFDCCWLELLVE